jgi:hypothetical protein
MLKSTPSTARSTLRWPPSQRGQARAWTTEMLFQVLDGKEGRRWSVHRSGRDTGHERAGGR